MRGAQSLIPAILIATVLVLRLPVPSGIPIPPYGSPQSMMTIPISFIDEPGPWPHETASGVMRTADPMLRDFRSDSSATEEASAGTSVNLRGRGHAGDPGGWSTRGDHAASFVDEPGVWPQRQRGFSERSSPPVTIPFTPAGPQSGSPAGPDGEQPPSTSIVDDGGGWPERR
jgi:hypothetical protein